LAAPPSLSNRSRTSNDVIKQSEALSVNNKERDKFMVMQAMRCLPQFVVTLAVTFLPSIAQSQTTKRDESIIIAGSIERKRVTVTRAELDKLTKHTAIIKADGTEIAYEGVALQSVLELVGVKFGKALRGDRLLGFVAVEGAPPPINAIVGHLGCMSVLNA
jgi:hypothetical protein